MEAAAQQGKTVKEQYEININIEGEHLPYCTEPTYHGITLDRSLMYCRHLKSVHKKLTERIELVRQLVGSGL